MGKYKEDILIKQKYIKKCLMFKNMLFGKLEGNIEI